MYLQGTLGKSKLGVVKCESAVNTLQLEYFRPELPV